MDKNEKILQRFDELIKEGNFINSQRGNCFGDMYKYGNDPKWICDTRDFINLYFSNSDYKNEFNQVKSSHKNSEYAIFVKRLNLLKGMQIDYITKKLKSSSWIMKCINILWNKFLKIIGGK